MSEPYVYLSPPDVGQVERSLLLQAFDSNWIAPVGPDLPLFEEEMAAYVGVRHAVALSSGTAALHLAILTAGIDVGADVLVPSLTFAATANCVRYVGARPVFVDSDPTTWTIDPEMVADEIRARARSGRVPAAVVTVDIYGQCADYDRLQDTCDRYGVRLIEDAAEALGANYRGRPAGSFGSASILSFNGNKIITCGGGGMLLTDSDDIANRARHLATQAREPEPHYEHRDIGYNYRLSNLLAAVARGQLRTLEDKVAARTRVNGFYRAAFADLSGIEFMPIAPYGVPNHWLTCILIRADAFGASREAVRVHLAGCGVEARPAWKPMHLQPVFGGCRVLGGSVAADIYENGLCLPSGSALSLADLERVCDGVLSSRAVGALR